MRRAERDSHAVWACEERKKGNGRKREKERKKKCCGGLAGYNHALVMLTRDPCGRGKARKKGQKELEGGREVKKAL